MFHERAQAFIFVFDNSPSSSFVQSPSNSCWCFPGLLFRLVLGNSLQSRLSNRHMETAEEKSLGISQPQKGLFLLLPGFCADSLSPFSAAEFIVTAMSTKPGRLFIAVTGFDYLDDIPVGKIHTIKANIPLLDKSLHSNRVLLSWSLSKDSSREAERQQQCITPLTNSGHPMEILISRRLSKFPVFFSAS